MSSLVLIPSPQLWIIESYLEAATTSRNIQKYPEISRNIQNQPGLFKPFRTFQQDIWGCRDLKIQSHFALWESTSKWSWGRCHLSEAVFLQVQNDTKWYKIVSNQNSRASFTMLYISHSVYVEFALCRVWFHANQKLKRATSRGVAPWKSLMAGQSNRFQVSLQKLSGVVGFYPETCTE